MLVALVPAAVACTPGASGAPAVPSTASAPPPRRAAPPARRPVHHARRSRPAPAPIYSPPAIRLGRAPRWRGEGVWRRRDRWAGPAPTVLTTGYALPSGEVAQLAWMAAGRTRLAALPGTGEPPVGGPRAGEVVPNLRSRLLATFNGGFRYAAAPGGLISQGVDFVPLQPGLATVWVTADHRVHLNRWTGSTRPTGVLFARQNLQLLVAAGRPTAAAADPALWGATLGGGTAVERTALGIDARHDLLYVAAVGSPLDLAQLLVRAGARTAMQLDINPEWATFNVYGAPGGGRPVMVVPNPQEPADRYLVPDSRDFFAVLTPPR